MNRLAHVQKTLSVNLDDNPSDAIQFVLLDYSSGDGLGAYIKDHFQDHLGSGKLVYYHYPSATSFDHSHSRNMAFRLAEGEVVCNIDADNYTGPGFGDYVQEVFQSRENVCLTGLGNPYKLDALGKLCVTKADFIKVTGYDEHFDGYGFEDFDIVNRLRLAGCEPFTITNSSFLQAISHADDERIANQRFSPEVENIYVHFIDADRSRLLYQLRDGRYVTASIVNMYTIGSRDPFATVEDEGYPLLHYNLEGNWEQGTWPMDHGNYTFHPVTPSMRREAILFYTQLRNRQIMHDNLAHQRMSVNKTFGSGIVYKNFKNAPIEL